MRPEDLIRLEAELEYGVALHGSDIPVTPANTADVPRVTVARYRDGYVVLFRSDLPDMERAYYQRIAPADLFALLATADPFESFGAGRVVSCCWYCINRIPDEAEFPDVMRRDGRFVIERDGAVAAEAWSAQDGLRAAEVEVETGPEFRSRGYGRQVVAAWAQAVRRDGKIALYSHLTTNDASRALARSIGAWGYAETRELF